MSKILGDLGGSEGGIRMTKGFVFKQRDIKKASVCIAVQRMAHHNHLIHLS